MEAILWKPPQFDGRPASRQAEDPAVTDPAVTDPAVTAARRPGQPEVPLPLCAGTLNITQSRRTPGRSPDECGPETPEWADMSAVTHGTYENK